MLLFAKGCWNFFVNTVEEDVCKLPDELFMDGLRILTLNRFRKICEFEMAAISSAWDRSERNAMLLGNLCNPQLFGKYFGRRLGKC